MESLSLEACPIKPRIKVLALTIMWWSIVLIGSYELTVNNNRKSIERLAVAEARTHFEKEALFRKWGAEQATSYRLISDTTLPNPLLSHVNERDILTTDGKRLTLVNPAMTHETVKFDNQREGIKGRLISLKPMNPANSADEWEMIALQNFEKGIKESNKIEVLNGQKYIRFVGPLFVEKSCLKCHEAGGYKLGDIRGGISIHMPYDKYDEILNSELFAIMAGHIAVWLIGAIGIVIAQIYLAKSDCKHRKIQAEADKLSFRNMLLGSLSEGVYGVGKDGVLLFINNSALNILGYEESEVIGGCPHCMFHYKYPNGDEYPREQCPSEKSIRNGTKHSGEDMLFAKDGRGIPVEINTVPIVQNGKLIGAVVAFRDISQRIKMQQELESLAKTDYLTQINNRRTFVQNLKQDFANFKRNSTNCAILMMDIDHFKHINDTYGHAAGDAVLKELSQVVSNEIREVDTVGRLGGEEFGVILRQTSLEGAGEFAERLRRRIDSLIVEFESDIIRFSVSAGVSVFRADDFDEESVLSRADKALYIAKNSGRNRVEICQE